MNTAELAAHPEYQALHAGVLAAPEDDLPRLVLADWLEEHQGEVDCPTHAAAGTPTVVCKVCNAAERGGRLYHAAGCRVLDMNEKRASNFAEVTCLTCFGAGRVSDGLKGWAEFIRVQCELDRRQLTPLPQGDPCTCASERHHVFSGRGCGACRRRQGPIDELRGRERVLWNAIFGQFRDRLGGLAPPGVIVSPAGVRCNPLVATVADFVVRRGFVQEVRCRPDDWCGRPRTLCPRCHGESGVRRDCEECGGNDYVGGTPGIGPRLLKLQPVQKVALAGIDPLPAQDQTDGRGTHGWFRGTHQTGLHPESDLPETIYDLLEGGRKNLGNREYDSRDEAVKAANAAALAWAKRWNPKADLAPPRVTA